ncbi:MAG: mannose-1-phosphate guanylyltransferase/mannose-6-phosphate isomerase [Candidatus Thioglobus sp.]|nr:mannose-1-phosphate guanylyltransferase/mannose-6-phosphate isomerase [Candidatus Thioglobus sp.]
MKIVPIILSGGSGTRLWPLSRAQYPKQYLPLIGDKTLLQQTILRLDGLENFTSPIVICNAEHRFLVAGQCQQIGLNNPNILLEPVGRNTAPAIAAAAMQAVKDFDNSCLLVLSADHIIGDISQFHQAIYVAAEQAKKGKLVTFGIVPNSANTAYGYIKSGKNDDNGAYEVAEFVEKPDAQTAKKYLQQENYLWNSGMFMFQAEIVLAELKNYAPEIVKAVANAMAKATPDLDFIRMGEAEFAKSPNNSIDYALLEKSKNVVVVPLDARWSDIGSWAALYEIGAKDQNGNVISGDVIAQNTTNTYISAKHHLVATLGVEDLIIVDTADATFIANRQRAGEVKNIVAELKKNHRTQAQTHRKVYRPWGWYDSIESGEHFQVKRLHINPQSKLSLQLHHRRAEHWVVVKGVASVTNGAEKFELKQGQSTYIPLGVKHSLANNTGVELEIIETQSGAYLGEDDIERFEDIYGRVEK